MDWKLKFSNIKDMSGNPIDFEKQSWGDIAGKKNKYMKYKKKYLELKKLYL